MPYEFYDKNLSKKTYLAKNNIDYSSTHMHNPIVVSHKNEDYQTNGTFLWEKQY